MRKIVFLVLAALMLGSAPALAHHSFAVHYVPDKIISVSGVVTKFRFANPHGVIFFAVTDENGEEVEWKGETNSPNMLRRRGWARDSLQPGDEITVEGYPSRDGSPMLRVAKVTKADGTVLVGQKPRGAAADYGE